MAERTRYNNRNQLEDLLRYASTTTSNLVATSEYSYDEFGRLSSIGHTSVNSFAEELDYTYGGAGRLASFSSSYDGYTVDYTYDARHQLVDADYTGILTDEAYD